MRLRINKELEERINQYVNGNLTETEIDRLWSDLIQDGHYLEYLKTIANLQRSRLHHKTGTSASLPQAQQFNQ